MLSWQEMACGKAHHRPRQRGWNRDAITQRLTNFNLGDHTHPCNKLQIAIDVERCNTDWTILIT